MRPTLTRLATAFASRPYTYLEAGAPTGLTGLLTAATPRSTLLYLYSTTLDSLQKLPEHSVYRRSTEALTRHRMRIVENVKPEGLSEWQERVKGLVDKHPEAFRRVKALEGSGENIVYREPPPSRAFRTQDDEVNAPYKSKPQHEGPRLQKEVENLGERLKRDVIAEQEQRIEIEAEPPLTVEQVGEIERAIGAGLIEEVITVAQGEKDLVETMRQDQVWEDLEEPAPKDQWIYNERKNM